MRNFFAAYFFLKNHLCSLVTFLQTNMDDVSMFCLGDKAQKCHIYIYIHKSFVKYARQIGSFCQESG